MGGIFKEDGNWWTRKWKIMCQLVQTVGEEKGYVPFVRSKGLCVVNIDSHRSSEGLQNPSTIWKQDEVEDEKEHVELKGGWR